MTGICIDCAVEFDASRRRETGSRPRRCVACTRRWCRAAAAARRVTMAEVYEVKRYLDVRASAQETATALGVPLRTLRHIEDVALRRWIGLMRSSDSGSRREP